MFTFWRPSGHDRVVRNIDERGFVVIDIDDLDVDNGVSHAAAGRTPRLHQDLVPVGSLPVERQPRGSDHSGSLADNKVLGWVEDRVADVFVDLGPEDGEDGLDVCLGRVLQHAGVILSLAKGQTGAVRLGHSHGHLQQIENDITDDN